MKISSIGFNLGVVSCDTSGEMELAKLADAKIPMRIMSDSTIH